MFTQTQSPDNLVLLFEHYNTFLGTFWGAWGLGWSPGTVVLDTWGTRQGHMGHL